MLLARPILSTIALTICCVPTRAQRLAFESFDIGDGLASSAISDVYEDTHGFLWIATWEGLSRFDGSTFVTYDVRDGLGVALLNGAVEDPHGSLWVATNGAGIARLIESGGPRARFESFTIDTTPASNAVNELGFDERGVPWCGTDGGLYRGIAVGDAWKFECAVPDRELNPNSMRTVCFDRERHVYAAVDAQMFTARDGVLRPISAPAGATAPWCAFLELDSAQRLVALYARAAYVLDDAAGASATSTWRELPVRLDPDEDLRCFVGDVERDLWIGTSRGLLRLRGGEQQRYGARSGLRDSFVRSLDEDHRGNLWIGTNGGGVARLIDRSLMSFSGASGDEPRVAELLIESDAGMVAALASGGAIEIVDDDVAPIAALSEAALGAIAGRVARDASGAWWIGTDDGLFVDRERSSALAHLEPVIAGAKVSRRPGLCARSDGSMLIGLDRRELWSCAVGREPQLVAGDLPSTLSRIAEGPDGALWLAGTDWMMRLRGDERLAIEPSAGLPETHARALCFDSHGGLWVGLRSRGLAYCEQPSRAVPEFRDRSAEVGLRSMTVWSLREGPDGTLWIGTGRGLHAFDPVSGSLRVWTSADGLAGDVVRDVAFDRLGRLWVATTRGVTRFEPSRSAPADVPAVRLLAVRAGGVELELPARGARTFAAGELAADQRSIEVDFIAPDSRGQDELAYQTMLEGAESSWSAPRPMRSVRYARLEPDRYSLLIRATDLAATHASEPARIEFEILPPFWRRAWFLAAVAAVIGAGAWLLHRTRVARAVALERVRSQIALDLHDDLGAGLAQIAIQSEVARRSDGSEGAARRERIAEIARGLRASMDDIVWAVDPRRDSAGDLIQRLRKTAIEQFESHATEVDFRAAHGEASDALRIPPDRRRHAHLIVKEALTNVARHAQAAHVTLDVALDARELLVRITDDGRGFDPQAPRTGRGLDNMARRARELGAELAIDSAPGHGTRWTLRIPLRGTPHERAGRSTVRAQ